jgi:S-methylmethionine-dependent homocysteine/selenocysteine methylase
VLYRWGFELPQFAMFPLLDNPGAVATMQGMWQRYLAFAERHGMATLMTGLDYRASPDWARKLGYSLQGLADAQARSLDFLRDVSAPWRDRLPAIVICGSIGPRGDSYQLNRAITAGEAEDYHSVQLGTLRSCGAEMACATTFNNIPESVGVIRAAAAIGIPVSVSLTLDSTSRLKSGPSLREAVETIDAETDGSAAWFAINCSHPVEFAPALDGGAWEARLRNVRPNASRMEKIALCKLGHLEEGDPRELGRQMGELARRWPRMDIWGGCCGTDHVHLDEIARNVRLARQAVQA